MASSRLVLSACESSALGSRRSAAVGTRRRRALGSSGRLVRLDFREAHFRELLPLAPLSVFYCCSKGRPLILPSECSCCRMRPRSTCRSPPPPMPAPASGRSQLRVNSDANCHREASEVAERRGSVALLCAFNLRASGTRLLILALH